MLVLHKLVHVANSEAAIWESDHRITKKWPTPHAYGAPLLFNHSLPNAVHKYSNSQWLSCCLLISYIPSRCKMVKLPFQYRIAVSIFWFLKMTAIHHIGFLKSFSCNGWWDLECTGASPCKNSSKSVNPLWRYCDLFIFSRWRPSSMLDLLGSFRPPIKSTCWHLLLCTIWLRSMP